jgi:MFS family permease
MKSFMLSCAGASLLVAIVVAVWARNFPEEAGAWPDNDRSMTREKLDEMLKKAETYRRNTPWTIKKVLSTPTTWKLAIGWSLPMMAAAGIMGQLTLALMSYGHEFMFGIILLSSLWPVGVLGNYLGGVVDNKFGTKKASYLVVIVQLIGAIIMLLFGANASMATIGVATFMFAISACTNISMSMTATIFGRNDFENAWPVISVVSKLIMSSGLVVIAWIAEKSSYNMAFAAMIVIVLAALVLMIATPGRCITRD